VFDAIDPGPDYQLTWPRELFRTEAHALLGLTRPPVKSWTDAAVLLLEEAFAGSSPPEDLRDASWADLPELLRNPWKSGDDASRAFLTLLADAAEILPEQSAPRPYWAHRRGAPLPSPPESVVDRSDRLRGDWVRVIVDLEDRGYLAQVAPRNCVDAPQPPIHEVLNAEIEDRLGLTDLWPLNPSDWDIDTFYSLIEVMHDLVARPRFRSWHDYSRCGWHYSNFALEPGRALYRWRVDNLLVG